MNVARLSYAIAVRTREGVLATRENQTRKTAVGIHLTHCYFAKAATARNWISSGQLRGANLAKGRRPRYIVKREDLDRFCENRQIDVLPNAKRVPRKKNSTDRY